MRSPPGKALFYVFKMAERDFEDSPFGVSSPKVFIDAKRATNFVHC